MFLEIIVNMFVFIIINVIIFFILLFLTVISIVIAVGFITTAIIIMLFHYYYCHYFLPLLFIIVIINTIAVDFLSIVMIFFLNTFVNIISNTKLSRHYSELQLLALIMFSLSHYICLGYSHESKSLY